MDTLQISPKVLDWAAAQSGKSLIECALKISKRNAESIINGILTNAQLVKFAKSTHVPLGYLFLQEPPPPRRLPVADFRTIQNSSALSPGFFETFDDIEYKQSWYKEMLESEGIEPRAYVGKYSKERPDPITLANEIRETLAFSSADRKKIKDPDGLFSLLANKCESIGILVFKNGVVGNNSRRPLDVSEFRGFVLADAIAPVIFINGADAPAAWVFTLAHELAHIWLGDSGVSDVDPATDQRVEKFCNSVAAEFLVPESDFLHLWQNSDSHDTYEKVQLGRLTFKVSSLVIARRALDLHLIDRDVYVKIYAEARKKSKAKGGGGDFYQTLAVRNSRLFASQVTNLAMTGSITLGSAGRLLNTNANNVVKFYAKQATNSL